MLEQESPFGWSAEKEEKDENRSIKTLTTENYYEDIRRAYEKRVHTRTGHSFVTNNKQYYGHGGVIRLKYFARINDEFKAQCNDKWRLVFDFQREKFDLSAPEIPSCYVRVERHFKKGEKKKEDEEEEEETLVCTINLHLVGIPKEITKSKKVGSIDFNDDSFEMTKKSWIKKFGFSLARPKSFKRRCGTLT